MFPFDDVIMVLRVAKPLYRRPVTHSYASSKPMLTYHRDPIKLHPARLIFCKLSSVGLRHSLMYGDMR